ncbi:MAG: thiol-disulfide oxidoreductase [Methanocella sp. PtaU1.Bin125]|nr:MAG: thiol-disulfide oxidoreductase [Methanocella sp. PtaU1.Bin125]
MYRMRGKVDVGDEAPGFRAKDVTYHDIDLAGYRGRYNIVLFFYRNSQCQTCREELTILGRQFDRIVGEDGDTVAISTDGFDVAKNLALDLHLPFHVVSDPEGDIIREYGVYDKDTDTAYPAVFLIDKNGVVRYRKILRGLDDLAPGEEIVDRLRGMGTPHGQIPFRSFEPD